MTTSKGKRTVALALRQSECKNLNFSPEKAGEGRVERVDLSLEFVVKDMEIDELVSCKGNPLKLLWHSDKSVMFREIAAFDLDVKFDGKLLIGIDNEHLLEFETAKMKKIRITPHIELQALIKCQVRVDPTGHLEQLGQIAIHQDCLMQFAGAEAEKDDKQQDLDV